MVCRIHGQHFVPGDSRGFPRQSSKSACEAYDFGGQEVYYAMHHLFLSAAGQLRYDVHCHCFD